MGIKLMTHGVNTGKERFVFETDDERDTLEDARNYFQSAHLFFNRGLSYNTSSKTSSGSFNKIKKGKDSRGKIKTISLEDWERIQYYAVLYYNGERYNPETFARPVIGELEEEALNSL